MNAEKSQSITLPGDMVKTIRILLKAATMLQTVKLSGMPCVSGC